jgi:hypothetical protein
MDIMAVPISFRMVSARPCDIITLHRAGTTSSNWLADELRGEIDLCVLRRLSLLGTNGLALPDEVGRAGHIT